MGNFDFSFLKSLRFWKLGLGALLQFLASQEIIPQDLAIALTAWIVGDVAIRTYDKAHE